MVGVAAPRKVVSKQRHVKITPASLLVAVQLHLHLLEPLSALLVDASGLQGETKIKFRTV